MRLLTLAILVLAGTLPASAAGVIRVTASCPGSDATTLDQTVVIPIFQQINGVEGLVRIDTEAKSDESCTFLVYFEPKADLDLAELRVQNRVSLALPLLPESCRQRGIAVQKLPAGPPQFWLALTSTDANHHEEFLNKFAIVNVKPTIARVPGVFEVRVVSSGDYGMRVLLDPKKLAAHKLMGSDIVDSLRRQNPQVGAGGVINGSQSAETIAVSGRMNKPVEFEEVILRASADGQVIRLKDVADVEISAPMVGFARVDGKPAALIEVTTWPERVTTDDLLDDGLADTLAPGMKLVSLANRSADRLLSVEVRLPEGSTLEQTEKVVAKMTELARGLPGKPSLFAFAENREPNLATIFVKSGAKDGITPADIDRALVGFSGATIRSGDAPPGQTAFPARMALTAYTGFSAPDEPTDEQFREVADRVVATLAKDKDIGAPAAFPPSSVPKRTVDVDRKLCAQWGIELNDLFMTLQTSLGGGVYASDFVRFGKLYRVNVQTGPKLSFQDLTKLKVRGASGEMVSLDKLITIRESTGPASIVRVNGHRAIVITANSASGKSASQVAARCVRLARDVLPQGYRAVNLTDR